MHPRLLAPFDAFERRKSNFLSELAGLDEAQLHFRPAPDAWSLLDVADHLSRVEAAVAETLADGIPPDRAQRKLKHVVKFRMVLLALSLPVRVPVPGNAPGVKPGDGLTLDGVREAWAASRAALAEQLASYGDEDMQRMVVRHPVAGPVNPRHTIAFLNAHFDHHRYQVARIRKHSDFPAAAA
ncbi:MAG TPA: DinB family protein [Thermoanaerobaculia bacterium]|nr:DinB family protein [Thermoanaerobaculia bacterium]